MGVNPIPGRCPVVEPLEGRRLFSAAAAGPGAGPAVVSERLYVNEYHVTSGFVLTFSEPLDRAAAENVENYKFSAHRGFPGLGSSLFGVVVRTFGFDEAVYDEAARTVTLKTWHLPSEPPAFGRFWVSVAGGPGGVRDPEGNPLDQPRPHRRGTGAAVKVSWQTGTALRFTDADGDRVSLTLTGDNGGLALEVLRDGKSKAPGRLFITGGVNADPDPPVLSGSVRRGKTGDGTVTLRGLFGLHRVRTDLGTDPAFRLEPAPDPLTEGEIPELPPPSFPL